MVNRRRWTSSFGQPFRWRPISVIGYPRHCACDGGGRRSRRPFPPNTAAASTLSSSL